MSGAAQKYYNTFWGSHSFGVTRAEMETSATVASLLKHAALIIGLPFVLFQLRNNLKKRPKQTFKYTDGKQKRELGVMEMCYHDYLKRNGAVVSFLVVIESACTLTDESLLRALSIISKKHPQLRMGIVEMKEDDDEIHYYFEGITEFHVDYDRADFDSASIHDCQEAFRAELLKLVHVVSGPLWRVTRLKEGIKPDTGLKVNCLVFTFHHAITDGISMVTVLEEMIDIINNNEPPVEEGVQPLLPSVETLLDGLLYVPWWKRALVNVGSRLANIGLISLKSTRNKPYFDKYPIVMKQDHSVQQETRAIFVTLSKSQTDRIVKECRAEKCTVTGAIISATSIAMAEILQDGTVKNEVPVPSGCLVNIRAQCNNEAAMKALGVFSTRLSVECKVPAFDEHNFKEVFWKLARQCTSDIHGAVRRDEHLSALRSLNCLASNSLLLSLFSSLVDSNNGGRIGSDYFCSSNLGKVNLSKGGHQTVQVTKLFFGVAEHIAGIAFINNIVTVNDSLCWSLIFYPNITRQEQAEHFRDRIFSNLLNAVGGW